MHVVTKDLEYIILVVKKRLARYHYANSWFHRHFLLSMSLSRLIINSKCLIYSKYFLCAYDFDLRWIVVR